MAQRCAGCGKAVYPLERILACNKPWHKSCFRCKKCDMVLNLKGFATIAGDPYCKPHYMEMFKSKGTYKSFTGDDSPTAFGTQFKGVASLQSSAPKVDATKWKTSKGGYAATTGFSGFGKVMAGVKATPELKKTTTTDTSAPKIPEKVSISKSPRPDLMEEVKTGANLSHTETTDKSAPVIEPGTAVKKVDRGAFLASVRKGAQNPLQHAETVDKTSVDLIAKKEFSDVKTKQQVVEDIPKLSVNALTKVKPCEKVDKSAPVIDSTVQIKKVDRTKFLSEVEEKAQEPLKSPNPGSVSDRSAPVIPTDVTIKKVDRKDFLSAVSTKASEPLKKVKQEDISNRSSPKPQRFGGSTKCAACGKTVYPLEQVFACEKPWHKSCFRCKKCNMVLSLKAFATIAGDPYCKPHYMEMFKSKGSYSAFSKETSGNAVAFGQQFKGVGRLQSSAPKPKTTTTSWKAGTTSSTSTASFSGVQRIMSDVKKADKEALKPTTTLDKAAPKIENVSVGTSTRPNLVAEVAKGTELKKAEVSNDRSAPIIEESVSVKKVDRKEFLSEVSSTKELAHVEPHESSPLDNVKNEFSDLKTKSEVMESISTADVSSLLKKVDEAEKFDKSAPIIEDVHIKKVDRTGFLDSVKKGKDVAPLKATPREEIADRSAPKIDTSVSVKAVDRKGFLSAVAEKANTPLKKVEAENIANRSSPKPQRFGASNRCAACGKTVYPLEQVFACDKPWHKACFRCKKCNMVLSLKAFATIAGDPYCKPHYMEMFKSKGSYSAFSKETSGNAVAFGQGFQGFGKLQSSAPKPMKK